MTPDLESELTIIANLKAEIDAVKPLKAQLEDHKAVVFTLMQGARSKRTEATAGVYALRIEKVGDVITDEELVIAWLEDNGYPASDYMKLNPAAVEKIADDVLKLSGEIIPGRDKVVSETLQIRSVKEK